MMTSGHVPPDPGVNANGITAAGINANQPASCPDSRIRRMFRFWLDVTKPDQQALTVTLDILIKERKFAPVIRDALRLYLDLKAGNTTVLFELFPLLKSNLNAIGVRSSLSTAPRVLPPPASGDDMPDFQVVKSNIDATANFLNSLKSIQGLSGD